MVIASFRAVLLPLVLLLAAAAPSRGFVTPGGSARRRRAAAATTTTALAAAGRRDFLATAAVLPATAASLLPLPASAKEAVPITRAVVTETFDAIRSELTSPDGVVATLTSLVDSGSFEEILQYTKESDAYFRKAKIGKARKLLTDPDLKGEAVLMSNAVTFDLIGINRASRPGREDRGEQLRYLEELKKDVGKILELEKTIEVVD